MVPSVDSTVADLSLSSASPCDPLFLLSFHIFLWVAGALTRSLLVPDVQAINQLPLLPSAVLRWSGSPMPYAPSCLEGPEGEEVSASLVLPV